MKIRTLNNYGIAHYLAPMIIVLVFAIGGVAYLVGSHADNTTTTGPQTRGYTYVGQATISSTGQQITAYACTSELEPGNWNVAAFYTMSQSYKTPNGFNWSATVTNTGTSPVANNARNSEYFVDGTPPTAVVNLDVNPQFQNPLIFGYSAGYSGASPTVNGTLALNIHPDSLAPCSQQPPQTAGYTEVGQSSNTGDGTMAVYACTTKISNSNWVVNALYTLSNQFGSISNSNGTIVTTSYLATIMNPAATVPVPNYGSQQTNFVDADTPTAALSIPVNPAGENPLTFDFTHTIITQNPQIGYPPTEASQQATIAAGIHPLNLDTCPALVPKTI